MGNDGNWGVFTTGLTAIWDLGRWIPSNYGGWYVKGGFQWYDLINNNSGYLREPKRRLRSSILRNRARPAGASGSASSASACTSDPSATR